jgi:hypothetical protein
MLWNATVEKVAINAVMAGCRPEYFPIVLAIATSGVDTGTTHGWHITVGGRERHEPHEFPGTPLRYSAIFGEKGESLPPGWLGLNEDKGYGKDENVVLVANRGGTCATINMTEFSPSSYRAFQPARITLDGADLLVVGSKVEKPR